MNECDYFEQYKYDVKAPYLFAYHGLLYCLQRYTKNYDINEALAYAKLGNHQNVIEYLNRIKLDTLDADVLYNIARVSQDPSVIGSIPQLSKSSRLRTTSERYTVLRKNIYDKVVNSIIDHLYDTSLEGWKNVHAVGWYYWDGSYVNGERQYVNLTKIIDIANKEAYPFLLDKDILIYNSPHHLGKRNMKFEWWINLVKSLNRMGIDKYDASVTSGLFGFSPVTVQVFISIPKVIDLYIKSYEGLEPL